MQEMMVDWQDVVAGRNGSSPTGEVLLRSWARSRAAGLDPESRHFRLRKVGDRELRLRLEESRQLIEVVRPHLEWLSGALSPVKHVVYVVDASGVVLLAEGTDVRMMEDYGLLPGYDWSEATMGTNGAGTAVVEGRPVAVFGDAHFLKPLHGFVCTAAPIRDPGGRVVGAVDISTTAEDGRPQNLLLAAQMAFAVKRELELRAAPEPGPYLDRHRGMRDAG